MQSKCRFLLQLYSLQYRVSAPTMCIGMCPGILHKSSQLNLSLFSCLLLYTLVCCCKFWTSHAVELTCPWPMKCNRDIKHTQPASQPAVSSHQGVMRGVTVGMSAFLACHQCYCAGSSLTWGLNLLAVVCGIFWSSSPGVFSGHSGFLPSFISLMVQPIK